MGLVQFAEIKSQDSSFGGVSRATVTLLDITNAWRAAGFTGVVIVGKGKMGRERRWLLGVGQALPSEYFPQVIPDFLSEIPFFQPGDPVTGIHIPQTIFIKHLLLIRFLLLSTANLLPL